MPNARNAMIRSPQLNCRPPRENSELVKPVRFPPGLARLVTRRSPTGSASSATDLAVTWVGPPVDFVGTMDLVAELQLDGTTIGNRQPIRIEWIAASPTVAAQAPTTTPISEAVSTEAQAATTMPVP